MSLLGPGQGAKLGVTLPLSSLLGKLPYAAPALGVHVVLPVQVRKCTLIIDRVSLSSVYAISLYAALALGVRVVLPVQVRKCTLIRSA
jgi:hypothetical protein